MVECGAHQVESAASDGNRRLLLEVLERPALEALPAAQAIARPFSCTQWQCAGYRGPWSRRYNAILAAVESVEAVSGMPARNRTSIISSRLMFVLQTLTFHS